MAIEALKVYDPIKKGDVVGNILDQVHSPTYNLKLYMIPLSDNSTAEDSPAPDTSRNTAPTNQAAMQSNNPLSAPPEQTIVLAQTGVTAAQIDNLTISCEGMPGSGTAIITNKIRFDIVQPGAADFLDQIVAAKKYLNIEPSSPEMPLILEVTFKGYSADNEDEDLGGQPITVAGPYRYSLHVSQIDLEITPEGSTYAFDCAVLEAYGYIDSLYRVPKKIESIGTTIEEHIADFEKKVNDYFKANYTLHDIQDEIKIDLSGIKKETNTEYGLSDLSLVTSDNVRAEEINRIMNPELEGKTEDEYKAILESASKDEGNLDIVVSENKVTVREGITISRYITTLLAMNDEFFSKISRKSKPSDPGDSEVEKDKPYVNWVKVNTNVVRLGYDKKRNAYAKKAVYKPVIYATGKTTVQIHPDENKSLTADQIRTRLDWMNVQKAYHYMYTGINDQIISCNIRYNAGVLILQAPAGGVTGEYSTVMAKTISSEAAPSDDLSGQTMAQAARKMSIMEKLAGGINKLFESAREDDIRNVGGILGFAKDQIKDAIINRTGLNAQVMKDVLSVASFADAIFNTQLTATKQNTTSDNIRNTDGSEYTYTPKSSGYLYGVDILAGLQERSDTAEGIKKAQNKAAEARAEHEANSDSQESDNVSVENQTQQANNPNLTEDATYDGTPKNTIFGYIMQQQDNFNADFLINLELEIKGDPWWMGPTDELGYTEVDSPGSDPVTISDPSKYANFLGNDIFILFDMQTPRRYDFNVVDEDGNTGYWSQSGTSYFISGVYRITKLHSDFTGGEFKQTLTLVKETPLQTGKIASEPESTDGDDAQPSSANTNVTQQNNFIDGANIDQQTSDFYNQLQ